MGWAGSTVHSWAGLAGLLFTWAIGLLFTVYPAQVIQWHARFYRRFHEIWHRGYEDFIDWGETPWERWLIGSRSEYIRKGPEDTQSFPRLIWFIRILGSIAFTLTSLALLYLVLSAMLPT